MALQDVNGILQALVTGQQSAAQRAQLMLEQQRLAQQAQQEQQRLKIEQQRADAESLAQKAARQIQSVQLQAQIAANPAVARAVSSEIGIPNETGQQRYALPISEDDISGNGDHTPLEMMVPTKEQELKDIIARSRAGTAGESDLAKQRAEQEHAFRLQEEEVSNKHALDRDKLNRDTQLAIAKLNNATDLARIKAQYGTEVDPSLIAQHVKSMAAGVETAKDLNYLKLQNPGLARAVAANMPEGFQILREDQPANIAKLRAISDIAPSIQEIIKLRDEKADILHPFDFHGKMSALDQTVQPIVQALGDTALRSQGVINLSKDAYLPDSLTSNNANKAKFNKLVDNLQKNIDAVTRNMDPHQRALIIQQLGITVPEKYYKPSSVKVTEGTFSDGSVKYSTDGGKTWSDKDPREAY